MNDDMNVQKAVPSDLSDHDERDEDLASDKHWDEESNDALATAEKRLREFENDGVPLSDEDWEKEEKEEEMADHIDAAVDEALDEEEAENEV